MKKELLYSFDDEPVTKFCYDLKNKRIEVHFDRHYDLNKEAFVDANCKWILKNWISAKVLIGDDPKKNDLSKCLGIFKLILYLKFNDTGELEFLVETVDNRYLTIFFKDPELTLRLA